jgi:hypothetical protein
MWYYNIMEDSKVTVEQISSNDNKVTSTKPKNPGRVAWGKKLAQMSKANKKAKKEGKPRTIKEDIEEDIKIDKQTNKMLALQGYQMWIGFGAVVIAGIALYYQMKSTNHQIKSTPNEINVNSESKKEIRPKGIPEF